MPVVQVGIMDMFVAHRLVAVPVRMRLGDGFVVTMAVMRVMDMRVLVIQRFVNVVVFVPFREVQP